jgi:hypothetical protein
MANSIALIISTTEYKKRLSASTNLAVTFVREAGTD